jgi:hypothetical protein
MATLMTALGVVLLGFLTSRVLARSLGTCPDCGAYWGELGRIVSIGERCTTCGHCSLR